MKNYFFRKMSLIFEKGIIFMLLLVLLFYCNVWFFFDYNDYVLFDICRFVLK